uniref:Uncharacterized protein n=1 Tax=Neolamprologus brichardi TaxID=32507 RepID=A0A3Q4H6Z8_NEOBR
MNAFDHSKTDALFQFSHISHSTQEHLKQVYSSLAICMCLAAGGSYVHVVARLVEVSAMVERKRLAMLAGFAFFVGVSLGPILDFVIINVFPSPRVLWPRIYHSVL